MSARFSLFLLVWLLSGCAVASWQGPSNQPAQGLRVAVLPVQVTETWMRGLTRPGPADTTAASRQKKARRCQHIGYQLQAALYERLRTQPTYSTNRQPVWLLAPAEVNQQLQQAGLGYDDLARQTPEQLRQLLGTDAVLLGHTTITRVPLSTELTLNTLLAATKAAVPPQLVATSLTLRGAAEAPLWQASFTCGGNSLLAVDASDLVRQVALATPAIVLAPVR